MFKLVAQIRSTSSLIDNYLLLLKHGDNLLLQYFNNVHIMKWQNILTLISHNYHSRKLLQTVIFNVNIFFISEYDKKKMNNRAVA